MTPDFDLTPDTKRIAVAAIKAPSSDVNSWVKSTGKPLQFRIVGQEREIALVPFNGVFDERYAVCTGRLTSS